MSKRVTRKSEIERVFDIKIAESSKMENAIDLWRMMYEDEPFWVSQNSEPMGIPGGIAAEIARLVTNDIELDISGSPMADFLQESYKRHVQNCKEYTEQACAMGGIIMKPYYVQSKGSIEVSVVQADEFFPTRSDSDGKILGAVFTDQKFINGYCFTRLERHELKGNLYGIENKCFCKKINDLSSDEPTLGDECLLSQVDEWKDIQPVVLIQNMERPLFAYFKIPIANNIERRSPLGVSVFHRATKLIRRADTRWEQINWEYDATEAAIHADEDMFIKTPSGDLSMEKRDNRLYRKMDGLKNQIDAFAPPIRDSSLFHGLNQIMRQIEFLSNLSFGTISDPNEVEKTAEEFKSSKHRSVSFVTSVQTAFQKAHEELIEAMKTMAVIYGLCSDGDYEPMFNFDDTMAINRSEAFKELMTLASAGMIKPEYVTAWYLGISEEEALKMMPPAFDDTEEEKPEEE